MTTTIIIIIIIQSIVCLAQVAICWRQSETIRELRLGYRDLREALVELHALPHDLVSRGRAINTLAKWR